MQEEEEGGRGSKKRGRGRGRKGRGRGELKPHHAQELHVHVKMQTNAHNKVLQYSFFPSFPLSLSLFLYSNSAFMPLFLSFPFLFVLIFTFYFCFAYIHLPPYLLCSYSRACLWPHILMFFMLFIPTFTTHSPTSLSLSLSPHLHDMSDRILINLAIIMITDILFAPNTSLFFLPFIIIHVLLHSLWS